MRKVICNLLAVVLLLTFVFQTDIVSLADNTQDWQEASWSQEEFNDILSKNNQINMYASGLIVNYAIAVSSSGSNLLIAGKTICAPNVVKCGFTMVTIKRRKSSSASWSTYKEYKDLYNKTPSYTLTKTITVSTGYQYRVYCTHYAKKNILSTEKISNASNIIAVG